MSDVSNYGIASFKDITMENSIKFIGSTDNTKSITLLCSEPSATGNVNVTIPAYLVNQSLVGLGTTAPSSATDTGVVGEMRVTSTHVYFCVSANVWRRNAISTF